MPQPFFSICMPAYQGGAFIRKAIASVRAQIFSDWELIIVDNASTDGTWEILLAEASRDPRIRIFRNASNIGLSENWNACLGHIRGEWIGTLAADDIYMPDALEHVYQGARDPNIAIWVHAHYSVHGNGRKDLIRPFVEPQRFTMSELALLFYQRGNLFGEISCYFLSAKAVRQIGKWIGKDSCTADLDFYMRVALANPDVQALYSPEILTETLIHEASDSARYIKSGQNWVDIFAFVEKFSDQRWKFSVRVRQALRLIYCLLRYGNQLSIGQKRLMRQSTLKVISSIKNRHDFI
jgi:glycosyltransferase involved in cell wall biosynthesis